MKNKILFVNGGSKDFGQRFREACEQHSLECYSLRAHHNSFIVLDTSGPHFFHLGQEVLLQEFSYCFIRVKGRAAYMVSLLSFLCQSYNIPFNDSTNIEHTQNDEKINQMVRFSRYDIPIPHSVIFSKESYFKNKESIQSHISYPCVLKTNGSKGEAVWKIFNEQELEGKMETVTTELFLVQELIPNTYDIRTLIFEKEVLGAIKRSSIDGFYNNVAKGGATEPITITEKERELSLQAMNILDLDFGGVDFVRTDDGIIFFEINKGPQVYGLEAATGLNIPAKLVEHIARQYFQ